MEAFNLTRAAGSRERCFEKMKMSFECFYLSFTHLAPFQAVAPNYRPYDPSPIPRRASHDLSHVAVFRESLPSKNVPLPDTDRHQQAPARLPGEQRRLGDGHRRPWHSEKAPGPLQRWAKQCPHRARERARGSLPPRPVDDFPGHAVALQVLPLFCHLRGDLVCVRSALVPGGDGARRPAG